MSDFDITDRRADERGQTAHHEAGHAVAAVARGGTFCDLSIKATTTRDGRVHVCNPRDAHDFVTFAGPWAEARFDWAHRPLDGVDEHGSRLLDYIRESLRTNANDLRMYEPGINLPFDLFIADLCGDVAPEIPLARYESWYEELESYWPTIQLAANMVLRGVAVTPGWVQAQLVRIAD